MGRGPRLKTSSTIIAVVEPRLSFGLVGFFDSVKAWFSREAAEVKQSVEATTSRLEAEMDRRERELEATPEERMEMIRDEIAEDPFAEVRARIEKQQAHADAVEDVDGGKGDDEATTEDPAQQPPV